MSVVSVSDGATHTVALDESEVSLKSVDVSDQMLGKVSDAL